MSLNYAKYFRPEVARQSAYHLNFYPRAIKLNQNELPQGFSAQVRRKFINKIKNIPLQRYPQIQPEGLRKKLARRLQVRPEQILVGNGSNVLIHTIISSAAVGDTVMGLVPSFSLYELGAKNLGNRFVGVRIRPPDFTFPLEKLLKKIKQEKPRLIFFSNPNAPTGNLFPRDGLLDVISKAKGLVVVDEAYYQFCGKTLLPSLKRYPNLIIMRTFSKGFGLGGARVGFLVGRAGVIAQIQKVLPPYGINPISEVAALLSLENHSYYKKIIAGVLRERERVFAAMKAMKGLEVYPSATNFLLFRVKDADGCFRHLLKKGVLIRNMSKGKYLSECLRVTIGTKTENNAFLRALSSWKIG